MFARRRARWLVAAAAVIVATAGCGDDDGGSVNGEATPSSQGQTGTDGNGDVDGGGSEGDCTHGPSCADGLIDELSAIPVPDSVDEFGVGSDVADRYSQSAFFDAPVSELVTFYEQELPAAGFEITRSEGQGESHTIDFVDPDQREGDLFIRTAATHESQIGYEVFRD